MEGMFFKCSSLKKLDISHFNTIKVYNMKDMFSECSSLQDLNLFNFKTNNVLMGGMFYCCPDNLIKKIKENYKNIEDSAFEDVDYYPFF